MIKYRRGRGPNPVHDWGLRAFSDRKPAAYSIVSLGTGTVVIVGVTSAWRSLEKEIGRRVDPNKWLADIVCGEQVSDSAREDNIS